MDQLLLLLLRTSAIWGLLLLFYYLILGKNDNWRLKRYYLLGIYLAGLVLPLLPTLYEHPELANYALSTILAEIPLPEKTNTDNTVANNMSNEEMITTTFWTLENILLSIYTIISLGIAVSILRSFFLLRQWKKTGQSEKKAGIAITKHPAVKVPIAGFNTIFLPKDMSQEEEKMASYHEKLHVQKGHLWERMPFLLGRIFLWFHPLQWLFQYLQEQIQEYEVDEGVLQRFSLPQYGKLLIQASMAPTMAWHPNLFSSPLKNRIDMMCKVKNKQSWRFYHTLALSLLLGFIVVSCTDVVDNNALEQTVIYDAEEIDQPAHVKDQDFDIDKPDYNIFQAVGKTIKYPKEARANQVEGTIVVAYTISSNGQVEDIDYSTFTSRKRLGEGKVFDEIVIIGYDPSGAESSDNAKPSDEVIASVEEFILEEIKRTITELDWSPALKDDRPVATRQILPIRFRLQ